MHPGSKEEVFKGRILEVLAGMALQYPSLSVLIDIWRPAVVNRTGYADTQTEVWVRVAESVPAFYVKTFDRWYEKEVGVLTSPASFVILPDTFNIVPEDHIILNGEACMVITTAEQAGISKVKIDKQKSRFVHPARSAPVYRQIGMKARLT